MDKKGIRDNNIITDNIVRDRLTDLPYTKLSRQEEINFIKKTKLSYYDSVDEAEKILYLEYYMEMFPNFRKSWDNADDKKKERLLQKAIQNSLYYRNKFLGNNYRLVLSITKHYLGSDDTETLFQEGVLGMMRALQKFDLRKGTRFSTYATLWIRQAITRYIADYSGTIRIPVQRRDQIFCLEKIQNQLISQLGRVPTKEELLLASNIDESQLDYIEEYQSYLSITSLSSIVGEEDDDTTLEDFIQDDSPNPYLNVEGNIMKEVFHNIINHSKLSVRDKKVLYMRYGFYDGHPYTLEEIGNYFNVSRERIRQIENRCLKMLRLSFMKASFNYDDFFFGTVSENDYVPLEIHSEEVSFMDSFQRDNVILELLCNYDMSQFDSQTREILNLRYGLCGVKSSVEETAKMLSLSKKDVTKKEENALKIIFSTLTELSPQEEQVKRMVLK